MDDDLLRLCQQAARAHKLIGRASGMALAQDRGNLSASEAADFVHLEEEIKVLRQEVKAGVAALRAADPARWRRFWTQWRVALGPRPGKDSDEPNDRDLLFVLAAVVTQPQP
jgi:hypothetical protein